MPQLWQRNNMEFKHFTPIQAVTPKTIIPNFTGPVDVFNPKKNIPHFEELAIDAGLGIAKGTIIKNTLKFFESPTRSKAGNLTFPTNDATKMPSVGVSQLGFQVYSNLTIIGDTYKNNDGRIIGKYDDIRIDAVLMDIKQDHNLIMTDIQGRDNTIFEFISKKSWLAKINGRILAKNPGVYPNDEVNNLLVALGSNKALRVTSWFLNMAGIYNLQIKGKQVPQEAGSQEYQKFEFEAYSDTPVILKLKK
jgi:hypothetical protein